MYLAIIGLAGLGLGVLIASSRVPRTQWAPLISALLLTGIAATTIFQGADASLLHGLTFVVACLGGSAMYAGVLWGRENLEPGIGYWGWVWRDFAHFPYLRKLQRDRARPVVPVDSTVANHPAS